MNETANSVAGTGDDATLEAMLVLADRLCRTEDPLLSGQYAHLRARIRALIQLRTGAGPDPA